MSREQFNIYVTQFFSDSIYYLIRQDNFVPLITLYETTSCDSYNLCKFKTERAPYHILYNSQKRGSTSVLSILLTDNDAAIKLQLRINREFGVACSSETTVSTYRPIHLRYQISENYSMNRPLRDKQKLYHENVIGESVFITGSRKDGLWTRLPHNNMNV